MKLIHLGRGLDNEVVLQDESVSRVHAQLFQDDEGSVFIIDLNSTNGTFVNGRKIQGRERLQRGDNLLLGTLKVFWEQYVEAEKAASPSRQSRHDTYYDDERPKSKLKPVLVGGGILGLATVLVVVLFTMRTSGSGSAQLVGKWNSEQDAAWIEFKEGGGYQEGFGEDVLLPDATWEKKGSSSLSIKRGEILVLYGYKVNGDQLTLTRNNQEEKYKKAEK